MERQEKILVIEDEPDTAEMFSEMIRLKGYKVLHSYGGHSAIELITKEKPDAIVLDIMMPDLSGLELLEIIRKGSQTQQIPVIVVSVKNLSDDVRAGFDAGATRYLSKPVTYQQLMDALNQVL